MADISVNRIPGEYTAPELTAKRPQTNTSFADLLKNAGAAAGADPAERMRPQRAAVPDEASCAAHTYVWDASGWLGKVSTPSPDPAAPQAAVVLEKLDGETDEDWQRRCIAFETSRRWQVSLSAWRAESVGMDVVDGILYCDAKATQWVTDLMHNEPAMFREWLNQERWHIEESGIDHAILPDGFTQEDMSRWMEKDVLEYLS